MLEEKLMCRQINGRARGSLCLSASKGKLQVKRGAGFDESSVDIPEGSGNEWVERLAGQLGINSSSAVCTDIWGICGVKFVGVASILFSIQLCAEAPVHEMETNEESEGVEHIYAWDASAVIWSNSGWCKQVSNWVSHGRYGVFFSVQFWKRVLIGCYRCRLI